MIFRWIIWAVVVVQACCFGQFRNGLFEIPDPNRSTPYFTPPKFWDFTNFAGLEGSFVPIPRKEHRDPNAVQWTIPFPFEGDSFVVLSTGDTQGLGSDPSSVISASVDQVITVLPENVLTGNYFFGTTDYLPFNDIAIISLIPADANDGFGELLLVQISVQDVSDYGATNGWQHFSIVFDEQTAGEYRLYCEVWDDRDTTYQSYLAVDNIRICRSSPTVGDINKDCDVNFNDFTILASAWLADCTAISDPNSPLYDPNIPCIIADIDKSSVVDGNDLKPITEYWLETLWTAD